LSVAKDAVDGGAGDKMALCQLAETLSALPTSQDGRAIENKGLASDVPALELRPPHASPDPLDDQVALQFGDGPDDDDNSSAQRTSGIDLLTEADELDIQPVQLIQHIEEVLHRPGDTIGSPDQDDIELTPAAVPRRTRSDAGRSRLSAHLNYGVKELRTINPEGSPGTYWVFALEEPDH
jgi:hypothetical protein